jgi:hypothetical protein
VKVSFRNKDEKNIFQINKNRKIIHSRPSLKQKNQAVHKMLWNPSKNRKFRGRKKENIRGTAASRYEKPMRTGHEHSHVK